MKELKNEGTDIELHSDEFREILGRVPGWILRRGITLVALIVLILLVGSALFSYPDIISTEMTLTGTNPPAALVAKTSGKLRELFIGDKQTVAKGEYLAVIENAAHTQDVRYLKGYLQTTPQNLSDDTITRTTTATAPITLPPKALRLGTMQSLYSNFRLMLFNYKEFVDRGYYTRKIAFMRQRIREYEEYARITDEQLPMVEAQSRLRQQSFHRDSTLHAEGLISQEAFETAKSSYLQSLLALQSSRSTVQNTRMQITTLTESLLDTEQQYRDRRNELENGVQNLRAQLQSEIAAWEQLYVLIAPTTGEVTFTNYWTANQNVTAGETVFTILPADYKEMIGKARMPAARSGKVKPGRRVNIRFVNFPDTEYGLVRGTVKSISTVPTTDAGTGSYYTVEIALPDGLTTTYGKELPYLPDMTAVADIVTEDISLLERFFLPIKKVWTEGMER
jgi:HlyD family secretion protein